MTDHRSPVDSPLQSYRRLHRLISTGRGSDAVWSKLTRTCLTLGKDREALDCLASVRSKAVQHALRRELAQHGLIDPGSPDSHPGAGARCRFSAADLLHDATTFVFAGHVRTAMLATILGFTLSLLVGRSVTAVGDDVGLRILALVPVLAAACLAGVLWRHAVLLGILGLGDDGAFPGGLELLRQVLHMITDALAIGAVLLTPAVALAVHVGDWAALLWFAVATTFLPMTAALRLCGRPWRSLSTRRLVLTLRMAGSEYLAITGIALVLLMPAFAVFTLTLGKPAYQVLSVTGLFAVVPCLLLARMLGAVLRRARPRIPHELAWGALPHAPRSASW